MAATRSTRSRRRAGSDPLADAWAAEQAADEHHAKTKAELARATTEAAGVLRDRRNALAAARTERIIEALDPLIRSIDEAAGTNHAQFKQTVDRVEANIAANAPAICGQLTTDDTAPAPPAESGPERQGLDLGETLSTV